MASTTTGKSTYGFSDHCIVLVLDHRYTLLVLPARMPACLHTSATGRVDYIQYNHSTAPFICTRERERHYLLYLYRATSNTHVYTCIIYVVYNIIERQRERGMSECWLNDWLHQGHAPFVRVQYVPMLCFHVCNVHQIKSIVWARLSLNIENNRKSERDNN